MTSIPTKIQLALHSFNQGKDPCIQYVIVEKT